MKEMIVEKVPCVECHRKTCRFCNYAVCDSEDGLCDESISMKAIESNKVECDKFVERLCRESRNVLWRKGEDGEFILGEKWRGFPNDFTWNEFIYWAGQTHSMGFDFVREILKGENDE